MKICTALFLNFACLVLCCCSASHKMHKNIKANFSPMLHSSRYYTKNVDSLLLSVAHLSVTEREAILLPLLLDGWMPDFLFHFKKVSVSCKSLSGKKIKIVFWASPDYVAIGTHANFVRMPLTPQAAQILAQHFMAVLPTTKMVDEIYKHAAIKLTPKPLTVARDSLKTFIKHHYIIQQQLAKNNLPYFVAGIKKDVVQTCQLHSKPNKVAIYGWHQLNGKPIQPLYTGHINTYVDYSHGIRLVYYKMLVNGKVFLVTDVLNNPNRASCICNETPCAATVYPNK